MPRMCLYLRRAQPTPLFAIAAVAPWIAVSRMFRRRQRRLVPETTGRMRERRCSWRRTFCVACTRRRRARTRARLLDHERRPAHGGSSADGAIVDGTGFRSNVRIWFGTTRCPPRTTLVIDHTTECKSRRRPARGSWTSWRKTATACIYARHASPGVRIRLVLSRARQWPTSGGTVVARTATTPRGTPTTQVLIDRLPCEVLAVRSPPGAPQELDCRTPADTAGAKPVRVGTARGPQPRCSTPSSAGNTDNGFKGRLSGAPLASSLRVSPSTTTPGRHWVMPRSSSAMARAMTPQASLTTTG